MNFSHALKSLLALCKSISRDENIFNQKDCMIKLLFISEKYKQKRFK